MVDNDGEAQDSPVTTEESQIGSTESELKETTETIKEDPETANLKEEIAACEAVLNAKRREVLSTLDQVDDFSKAGYARKVAEMDNMRRKQTVSYYIAH